MKNKFIKKFLKRFKQMTPEERLRLAFDRTEFRVKLYSEGRRHTKEIATINLH